MKLFEWFKLIVIFIGTCFVMEFYYQNTILIYVRNHRYVTDVKKSYEEVPWFLLFCRKHRANNESHCHRVNEANARNPIFDQLMSVPKRYNATNLPKKSILVLDPLPDWMSEETKIYSTDECPVNRCVIVYDSRMLETADAIFFVNRFENPYKRYKFKRPLNQVWIYRTHEPPHKASPKDGGNLINWTISYRKDSVIPSPYGMWVYCDQRAQQSPRIKNYAENKTRQVMMLVSNCHRVNNRLEYARELQKYISVDIYGRCGPLKWKCPRSETLACLDKLGAMYKFYLAFENSNCIEYITEKFHYNALQKNMLPIVMGARPEDYASVAPPNSYLHVDDFSSPKELAHFLKKLDTDDDLYNSYFEWKGTVEFIDLRKMTWCTMCSLLHEPIKPRVHYDINRWWTQNTCIKAGPWPKNMTLYRNITML